MPSGDSVAALAGVKAGSRTKTALSNVAFSAVPISAYPKLQSGQDRRRNAVPCRAAGN